MRGLVTALGDMEKQYGGDKTLEDIDMTATLVANMRSLGDRTGSEHRRGSRASTHGRRRWSTALNASPMCNIDPACIKSRDDLNRVVTAYEDGSLDKLVRSRSSTQGDAGQPDARPDASRRRQEPRRGGRRRRASWVSPIAASIQQKLNSVQQGATQLADASQQLAEGVQLLVDKTREMGGGLDQASAFLLAMKRDAANPPMSGFYIPPRS